MWQAAKPPPLWGGRRVGLWESVLAFLLGSASHRHKSGTHLPQPQLLICKVGFNKTDFMALEGSAEIMATKVIVTVTAMGWEK
jgi:hypothetical protein